MFSFHTEIPSVISVAGAVRRELGRVQNGLITKFLNSLAKGSDVPVCLPVASKLLN